MNRFTLRPATRADFDAIAEIIYIGTNYWYETHGMGRIFQKGVSSARVFSEVYADLDPGCCLVAFDSDSGRPAGSCFYRIRPTHVSLGIMNVHPAYFGQGVARELLKAIIAAADREAKPLRLVSSALNLDSFSLYNRAGFVPRLVFQDMILSVPITGMTTPAPDGIEKVRPATVADLSAIVALEREIQGIERAKDWQYFLNNENGIWKTFVFADEEGHLRGALSSVAHPGSNLIGPGIAHDSQGMAPLLWAQLNARRGTSPVFLLPVQATDLVQSAYGWGAKNCELHVAQCRGDWFEPTGVVMPTFLPESA